MEPCDKIIEQLGPHIDGELTPTDAERVERHVVRCAGCARELQALKQLDTAARASAAPEVGDGEWTLCWERVRAHAVAAPKAIPAAGWRRVMRPRWLAPIGGAVAAIAAALVLSIGLSSVAVAESRDCEVVSVETDLPDCTPMYYYCPETDVAFVTVIPDHTLNGKGI